MCSSSNANDCLVDRHKFRNEIVLIVGNAAGATIVNGDIVRVGVKSGFLLLWFVHCCQCREFIEQIERVRGIGDLMCQIVDRRMEERIRR